MDDGNLTKKLADALERTLGVAERHDAGEAARAEEYRKLISRAVTCGDWRTAEVPPLRHRELAWEFVGRQVREYRLDPALWSHVRACRFGDPRPISTEVPNPTKWSGESYRYDIFKHSSLALGLRCLNGSGATWLVFSARDGAMLSWIAWIPEEARRWDLCHLLYQLWSATRSHAAAHTRAILEQAFLEGRMKKRRQGGKTVVTILHKIERKSEEEEE